MRRFKVLTQRIFFSRGSFVFILLFDPPFSVRASEVQVDLIERDPPITAALILGAFLLVMVPVIWQLYRKRPIKRRHLNGTVHRQRRGLYNVSIEGSQASSQSPRHLERRKDPASRIKIQRRLKVKK